MSPLRGCASRRTVIGLNASKGELIVFRKLPLCPLILVADAATASEAFRFPLEEIGEGSFSESGGSGSGELFHGVEIGVES
jgi:hypothetical protein